MFSCNCLACLQLHDDAILHEKICKVFTKHGPVFVKDGYWMLSLNVKPQLPQSIDQSILIYFFEVAMGQVRMNQRTQFPGWYRTVS